MTETPQHTPENQIPGDVSFAQDVSAENAPKPGGTTKLVIALAFLAFAAGYGYANKSDISKAVGFASPSVDMMNAPSGGGSCCSKSGDLSVASTGGSCCSEMTALASTEASETGCCSETAAAIALAGDEGCSACPMSTNAALVAENSACCESKMKNALAASLLATESETTEEPVEVAATETGEEVEEAVEETETTEDAAVTTEQAAK